MVKPYYERQGVEIYHADALEYLRDARAQTVRGVFTDPPYILAAGSNYHQSGKTGTWADMMNASFWYQAWYREVWRVLKHDGCFWTFANWRSLPVVMQAANQEQIPINSLLVWDKQWIGPGGHQGLRPSYELVALAAKPDFAIPNRGLPDIWQCQWSAHKPNGHPAEKPVELMERLLRESGMTEGDLVLDPFVGSGTTLEAARRLGLRAVGVEADERNCELAAKRLSQELLFQACGA